jgi:hypothetical protein
VGPHELFHVAVLAGVSLHWRFVAQFASGKVPPEQQDPRRRGINPAQGHPPFDPCAGVSS